MKKIYKITGMHCASCAKNIEKAVKKIKDVNSVSVNFATNKLYFDYDKNINDEYIEKAVSSVGDYHIMKEGENKPSKNEETKTFVVKGLDNPHCAMTIENALKKIGIEKIKLNTNTHKATITSFISREKIIQAINDAGYEVLGEEETEEESEIQEMNKAKKKMFYSWLFAIPIAVIGILFERILNINNYIIMILPLLLSIPILFILGFPTIKSALKSIKYLSFNMDVLISLGTIIAFLTGILRFFMPIEDYSGIGGMIMAFFLTGRYVEAKARGRASLAIKELLKLEAKNANIIVNGKEKQIKIEEVKISDIMIVKPGEKIPTDGIVIKGESSIDESMITGESMPIDKAKNDKVIGATINQDGALYVKATKIGKDTFLSQIIKLVEEAQGSKIPIQEFADKVTGYFVPAVLLISILTFIFWFLFPDFMKNIAEFFSFLPWINLSLNNTALALFAAIAVLVIACPCALGLATPTALMVSSGIGAEKGILIRKGEAIQTMKDIKFIVFDKTGTLTKGLPELTDIIPINSNEKEILKIAASVESVSEHPISKAIVNKAKHENLRLTEPKNFKVEKGKGIKANLEEKRILIGNRILMDENNIDYKKYDHKVKELENNGKTVVIVSVNRKIYGLIAVADSLKPESEQAIKELHSLGFKTIMITGDNKRTASAIAKQLAIDEILAEVLPEEKERKIKELQNQGFVAFVGDGINDAPALKQANVGIAIGTGTDIAIEAGDIVLANGNLTGVVQSINLSRATFRKIKQNLFWAFAYNTVAIPLAILGILHPIIAEIAMALSSITVVTNANLLKREKI